METIINKIKYVVHKIVTPIYFWSIIEKPMSTNKEMKINKPDFEFLEKALIKADKLTKANNGHDYVTTLKTICQSCGHKEYYKKRCPNWFSTFINKLKFVYLNPGLLEIDTLRDQKNKKNK